MNVKYLVRLDDACPSMHKENWKRFEEVLDKFNIKPLVGVIPNNQDEKQMKSVFNPSFWNIVADWERKGWEIALHGNNHIYQKFEKPCGINPINTYSEFVGKSLTQQKKIVREAWTTFLSNGIEPKYFFAPAHTFDKNTLQALEEETNIRLISDMIASKPFYNKNFVFIPCQMGYFRSMKLPGIYTACYHPNEMNESDFKQLEKFIELNKSKFINFIDLDLSSVKKFNLYDRILKEMYFLNRKIRKKNK